MLCPNCHMTIRDTEAKCPFCGSDLSDLLSARYQPDLLFNEALTLLGQQRWTDACDTLCRAHALRPQDAGILELWVRAEYLADNKRRAVELMADLIDLDDSAQNVRLLNELSDEYDREQGGADTLVRRELEQQSDRLSALLDRMERGLRSAGLYVPAPRPTAVPAPAPTAPAHVPDTTEPTVTTPHEQAEPLPKDRMPRFSGRMPSLTQLTEMLSAKDTKA